MSAAFVKSRTVTSNRSGCFNKRFNRTAAGTRRFTFCRNRTGSIESSPLSIPLKKNETIQQQKMIKAIIMLLLQKLSELFSPGGFPRFFCALRDARLSQGRGSPVLCPSRANNRALGKQTRRSFH